MKVNLHGAFVEVELTTNFLVREPKGNQIYDFPLTWCQCMIVMFALQSLMHVSLPTIRLLGN